MSETSFARCQLASWKAWLIDRPFMRPETLILVLLACFAASAARAGDAAGCEILSTAQVSAVVGKPLKGGAKSGVREDEVANHCGFAGDGTLVDISLIRLSSEHAAIRRYEKALQRSSDAASRDEPLHGVGIESRLRTTATESTIIARFGVHVVVVTTNAGREAVVGLARAIGAKVTAQP